MKPKQATANAAPQAAAPSANREASAPDKKSGQRNKGSRSGGHPDTSEVQAHIVRSRTRYLFDKKFTQYEVSVSVSNMTWSVFRRYSEFETLHRKLSSAYRNVTLPKLPGKRWTGNMTEKFLEERRLGLGTYLSGMLSRIRPATSVPIMEFLGLLTDHSKESKRPRVQADVICKMVKPGDLILFRTQGTLPALQRTVLSSEYDHVGVVVSKQMSAMSKKYHHSAGLFLLESTNEGVHTYPLMTRVRAWHLSGAVMVVRQLRLPKEFSKTETERKLQHFTQEEEGKGYGLNPLKLLRRKAENTHNTYFCSELVASAYQTLGVLPEGIAANSYYPSTFAERNSLKLLAGELGQEVWVEFWQPEVLKAKIFKRRGRSNRSQTIPIAKLAPSTNPEPRPHAKHMSNFTPAAPSGEGGLLRVEGAERVRVDSADDEDTRIMVKVAKKEVQLLEGKQTCVELRVDREGDTGDKFSAMLLSQYATEKCELTLDGCKGSCVLPKATQPGRYRLKVSATANPFLSGYSGFFSLVSASGTNADKKDDPSSSERDGPSPSKNTKAEPKDNPNTPREPDLPRGWANSRPLPPPRDATEFPLPIASAPVTTTFIDTPRDSEESGDV